MKATDLRIGNLVLRKDLFDNKQKFKETIVCHNAITACYTNNDNFQPIPLTEEWLLKFGLKSELNGYYYIDDFVISLDGYVYFGIEEKYIRSIEFVHDLQNLYYAIKGEELTYDPN